MVLFVVVVAAAVVVVVVAAGVVVARSCPGGVVVRLPVCLLVSSRGRVAVVGLVAVVAVWFCLRFGGVGSSGWLLCSFLCASSSPLSSFLPRGGRVF